MSDGRSEAALPAPPAPPRRPLPFFTRKGAIRAAVLLSLFLVLLLGSGSYMIGMPGKSFQGPLAPLSPEESALARSIRGDVEKLAGEIGIRNAYSYAGLMAAADYVEERFRKSGYEVSRHAFQDSARVYHNLEAEIPGSGAKDEIVILGAHYDSVIGSPGANDNASAVGALLALARLLAGSHPSRTIRFVAFANEEPPFFRTPLMGSRVYARRCRERGERVAAMLSMDTIGCYSDESGSQGYPFPLSLFYPSVGNFIAFVGNLKSRGLVRQVVASFRNGAAFPSEGAALPSWIPGVDWSDHRSFWEEGYPAMMITDTAPNRYAYYHTDRDTPDKVDYKRCARVVIGLEHVLRDLAYCASR